MYSGQSGYRNFAPVNVGDELDVTIEAVGGKGDGIAKVKGFVIFVPNVKKGDNVKIKITKVLRKVGFGEVLGHESEQYDEQQHDKHKKGKKHAEDTEMTEEMTENEEQNEMSENYSDSEDFGEES